MQVALFIFLFTTSAWPADADEILLSAQNIIPKVASYRKISGPVEDCPGEKTILWRSTPQGAYLQLTPRLGFSGFGKTGWINRPEDASLPDCVFESRVDIGPRSIQYREKEDCPKQKWQRRRSLEIERKGEFGIVITNTREVTKEGAKESALSFRCEMIVKK